MSQSFDIAVIGATGTVGETLVQILEERDFPVGTLHLLASSEFPDAYFVATRLRTVLAGLGSVFFLLAKPPRRPA